MICISTITHEIDHDLIFINHIYILNWYAILLHFKHVILFSFGFDLQAAR